MNDKFYLITTNQYENGLSVEELSDERTSNILDIILDNVMVWGLETKGRDNFIITPTALKMMNVSTFIQNIPTPVKAGAVHNYDGTIQYVTTPWY